MDGETREKLREIADELDGLNREAVRRSEAPINDDRRLYVGKAIGYANAESMVRALLEAEEESGADRTPRFCPRCHEPMERATGEDAEYGHWRCDHNLDGKRLYYDYELDLIYRPAVPEPEPEEGEPDVEVSPEQLERLRQGGVEDSIRRRMLIRHDKTIRGLEERIEALEERVEKYETGLRWLLESRTPEPDSEPEPEDDAIDPLDTDAAKMECYPEEYAEPERDEGGEDEPSDKARGLVAGFHDAVLRRGPEMCKDRKTRLLNYLANLEARLRSRPSEEAVEAAIADLEGAATDYEMWLGSTQARGTSDTLRRVGISVKKALASLRTKEGDDR